MPHDYENDLQDDLDPYKTPPMTVCVAAICDRGKAVVVAADRSVAYGQQYINPNGTDCKILQIAPTMIIAVADSPPGADFFDQFNQDKLSALEPKEIANQVELVMKNQFKNEVEKDILAMRGNKWKSYDDFWFDTETTSQIMDTLKGEIVAHNLNTRVIVAGVNNSGESRLYRTNGKAEMKSFDQPGYVAIGAGEHLAIGNLFARSPSIKEMSIGEAVYFVYEAKKMAERHRGVGDETDMVIIRDSIVPVTREQMDGLEKVYQALKVREPTKANRRSLKRLLDI